MTRLALFALGLALSSPAIAEDKPPPAPLGVEAVMEGGEKYKGPIRVRGVVGKTAAEKQLFSLVDMSDRDELIRTGKTQCVTLPVRWTKEMPRPHTTVLVAGQVRELDGRQVFVAETVTPEADNQR